MSIILPLWPFYQNFMAQFHINLYFMTNLCNLKVKNEVYLWLQCSWLLSNVMWLGNNGNCSCNVTGYFWDLGTMEIVPVTLLATSETWEQWKSLQEHYWSNLSIGNNEKWPSTIIRYLFWWCECLKIPCWGLCKCTI